MRFMPPVAVELPSDFLLHFLPLPQTRLAQPEPPSPPLLQAVRGRWGRQRLLFHEYLPGALQGSVPVPLHPEHQPNPPSAVVNPNLQ